MKGGGLYTFIDKANFDMAKASNDYLFERKYTKNPERALQKANERMYKALQDRELFTRLANKFYNEGIYEDED